MKELPNANNFGFSAQFISVMFADLDFQHFHTILNSFNTVTGFTGGSYFAENGNLPIFVAGNGKVVYLSVDIGHKKSDGNGNNNLEGRKTKFSI